MERSWVFRLRTSHRLQSPCQLGCGLNLETFHFLTHLYVCWQDSVLKYYWNEGSLTFDLISHRLLHRTAHSMASGFSQSEPERKQAKERNHSLLMT